MPPSDLSELLSLRMWRSTNQLLLDVPRTHLKSKSICEGMSLKTKFKGLSSSNITINIKILGLVSHPPPKPALMMMNHKKKKKKVNVVISNELIETWAVHSVLYFPVVCCRWIIWVDRYTVHPPVRSIYYMTSAGRGHSQWRRPVSVLSNHNVECKQCWQRHREAP